MRDKSDTNLSLSYDDSSISSDDTSMPPIADNCSFMPADEVYDHEDDDYFNVTMKYINANMTQSLACAEIVEDDIYMDTLGISPERMGNMGNKELQAHIIGGLMAKGELLQEGIPADQLEMNLKECIGISLGHLVGYMEFQGDEMVSFVSRFEKQKSAMLFEPVFRDIVEYSATNGCFKPVLTSSLKYLYDQIVRGGKSGQRRRDQAEQNKLDKMRDPVNRKRYMISCNMLLDIVNTICRETCRTEVGWQDIQNFYRKMMSSRSGGIYNKYNGPLQLDELAKTTLELNQISARSLFGRGTASKALSSDIFNKISHKHDGKQIVLCLNPDFAKNPEKCTYGKEDFAAIDAAIAAQNRSRQDTRRTSHNRENEKMKKEEKEKMELEERRKTFNMPEMSAYVPDSGQASSYNPPAASRFGNQQQNSSAKSPTTSDYSPPPRPKKTLSRSRPNEFNSKGYAQMMMEEKAAKEAEEKKREEKEEREDEEDRYEDEEEEDYDSDEDAVSSDGGRPTNQRRFFSDDDESECQAEKLAHEQRMREGEEKRRRAREAQAAREETQKHNVFRQAAASSRSTSQEPVSTSEKVPLPEKKAEAKPAVSKPVESKETLRGVKPPPLERPQKTGAKNEYDNIESDGEDQLRSPIIYASPSARWDVPLPSEDREQKKGRIHDYVSTSGSHHPLVERRNIHPASIITERESSICSLMEHSIQSRRHPAPSTSTIGDRIVQPPRPRLGSTRPESHVLRHSVRVQTSYDGILDELGGRGGEGKQGPITDPTVLRDRRSRFITFISFYVYFFRSNDGLSKRLWSELKKGLDPMLAMPETFMGENWREELRGALPKLRVMEVPPRDTLFFWDEEEESASRRPSAHSYC